MVVVCAAPKVVGISFDMCDIHILRIFIMWMRKFLFLILLLLRFNGLSPPQKKNEWTISLLPISKCHKYVSTQSIYNFRIVVGKKTFQCVRVITFLFFFLFLIYGFCWKLWSHVMWRFIEARYDDDDDVDVVDDIKMFLERWFRYIDYWNVRFVGVWFYIWFNLRRHRTTMGKFIDSNHFIPSNKATRTMEFNENVCVFLFYFSKGLGDFPTDEMKGRWVKLKISFSGT